MYYIHPTECIECGLCKSICPVDAIRYDDEVPEAEQAFISLNEAVFKNAEGVVTEPGGWSKNDAPLADPPEIRALAPNN